MGLHVVWISLYYNNRSWSSHTLHLEGITAYRRGQLAYGLHLMPFVIAQAINPKLLKAPQDVYKPGSVYDIPLLLKNSGPQQIRLTRSGRTTNILINNMNTSLFITAEIGVKPSSKSTTGSVHRWRGSHAVKLARSKVKKKLYCKNICVNMMFLCNTVKVILREFCR